MGGRVERTMQALMWPWVATCEETRERLSDHLEGNLVGRDAKRVLRHLARCDRCREVLRSLAHAVESMRSLARVDVPSTAPSVADVVVERIRRDGL